MPIKTPIEINKKELNKLIFELEYLIPLNSFNFIHDYSNYSSDHVIHRLQMMAREGIEKEGNIILMIQEPENIFSFSGSIRKKLLCNYRCYDIISSFPTIILEESRVRGIDMPILENYINNYPIYMTLSKKIKTLVIKLIEDDVSYFSEYNLIDDGHDSCFIFIIKQEIDKFKQSIGDVVLYDFLIAKQKSIMKKISDCIKDDHFIYHDAFYIHSTKDYTKILNNETKKYYNYIKFVEE